MNQVAKAVITALTLVISAAAMAASPGGIPLPSLTPTTFTQAGETLLVADQRAGTLQGGSLKGQFQSIPVNGRVKGVGGADGKNGVVIVGEQSGNLKAITFGGGKLGGPIDLKPSEPLKEVTDVAVKNEILWVLQQNPPLVALFGNDGAELSRFDLSGVCIAPFSLSLAPSGEGYVADPLGAKVLQLDQFGAVKTVFDLSGTGYTRPTSIALDDRGRLYIGDTILGEVALFAVKEKTLVKVAGLVPFKIEDPLRLALYGDSLWVLQGWQSRLARFPIK